MIKMTREEAERRRTAARDSRIWINVNKVDKKMRKSRS